MDDPLGVGRSVGRRAIVGSAASTALSAVPPFLSGSLSPFMGPELGLTTGRLGVVIALYFGATAVTAIPASRLSERLGGRRGIVLANVGTGLALLSIGALARSWIHLAVALTLAGAANGVLHPAGNLLLMRKVPVARRGLAFGLKQSAAPIATLLAGAAIPTVATTVGWRWSFLAASSVLPFVAAILPTDHAAPANVQKTSRTTGPRWAVDRVTVAAALAFGAATTVSAFLSESVVSAGGDPSIAAGALMSAGVACVSVRVVVGWYTDRSLRLSVRLVSALFAAGSVGFWVVAMSSGSIPVIVGAAVALGAGWGWPGLLYHIVASANPVSPAAATAVTTMGNAAGAAVGPVVFGLIAARYSFTAAWGCSALALSVAAWLVLGGSLARPRAGG